MNYLKYLTILILSIFFTITASATLYEDAEDQSTVGWEIIDNDPSGATITNIFDSERNSRVIELKGSKTKNAYELGKKSGTDAWNNQYEKVFSWKMKTKDRFRIYIYLKTTKGTRYLYYTSHDTDKGHYKTRYIHHGLGSDKKNNQWHTFSRDLEADLQQYESDNSIISINGFKIKGSASLDDMELTPRAGEEDITPPVITLNGSATMTLSLGEPYPELGATANDNVDGSVDVSISGSVNSSVAGEYIITYSAIDSHNNSSTAIRTVTVHNITQGDGKLILNEYNAVKSSKKLKNSGSDSHFGRIIGNGGSWIELVSTGKHIDIRGARLIIKQSGSDDFSAKLPYETQLGHLRRGTILTISSEPTDMSYAPFSPNGDDWTLNININDLLEKVGTFKTSSSSLSVALIDKNGAEYLLPPSGEEYASVSIGNNEVFKLKKNPAYGIPPSDGAYGDDGDGKAYSTFGAPNQWGSGGQYHQSFNGLRANQDLTEIGGMVVSTMPALSSVTDAESLLYLPQNDTLWIADDDTHVALEMKFSTQTLLSTYDDVQLGSFAATMDDVCDRGAKRGVCDIESVAYNSDTDDLFIYVGKSASQSAIFRLTRTSTSDQFGLADYIDLDGHEYSAVVYANSEMVVAIDKDVYTYDYSTNTKSSRIFRSPDGKIFGMAYHNGIMWLTTSKFKLIKIDWASKNVEAIYDMTKNGVYDPRGIEIINNKLYILEGMNAIGSNQVLAPLGHALKNSIHIYNIP